jgi:hypothetical protein
MMDDLWTRRRSAAFLLVALIVGVFAPGAAKLAAQGGHRTVVGLMPMNGSTTLATRSAAAGTKIWIRTANLPARTDVQIMMGALRDGFEVIATRATDEAGKIQGMDSLQVEVPQWVKQTDLLGRRTCFIRRPRTDCWQDRDDLPSRGRPAPCSPARRTRSTS